jgi:hypothetical protein
MKEADRGLGGDPFSVLVCHFDPRESGGRNPMRSIVPSLTSGAGGGSFGSLIVFGTSLGSRLGMTSGHNLKGERNSGLRGILRLIAQQSGFP